MSKNEELIELADQSDVDFRFERPDYFAFGTGKMETYRGQEREKLIFVSKDYVKQDIASGKRIFTCPEWYAINKGLV